jgi:hypothetical protein
MPHGCPPPTGSPPHGCPPPTGSPPHGCPPPTGSPPHDATYESVEIITEARTAEQNKANTNRNSTILKFMVFHLLYFWLKNSYTANNNKKYAKPNQCFSLVYHIWLQIALNIKNPERAYSKLHGKSAEQNPKHGFFEKTLCQWGRPKKSKMLKVYFAFILQKAQRTPKLTGNSDL